MSDDTKITMSADIDGEHLEAETTLAGLEAAAEELDGMPKRLVRLTYAFRQEKRATMINEEDLPHVGDPVEFPPAEGEIVKISESRKNGLTVYEAVVKEDPA